MSVLVGLISDTHGILRPEVFPAFGGVDRIIHAGDVGDADILTELEAIAPVTAVWGNTDEWPLRDRLPEVATLEIDGVKVVVIHGQQFGSPSAEMVVPSHPDAGLIVFGHSHVPKIERIGTVLTVNPGSAGPRRFKLPSTVALASFVDGQVEARLVDLTS